MDIVSITSAQNNGIKHLVRLRERREREKEKLTVLEGYRELTRADEYGMTLTEVWFSPELFLGENEYPLLARLAAKGAKIIEINPAHSAFTGSLTDLYIPCKAVEGMDLLMKELSSL